MADKPTLLVIEDDAELVQLYKEMFSNRGWQVLDTMDADEAMELALHHLPKAIVLDLMLPKSRGLEILKTFKSLPETKSIPVVVVTAYPNPEFKEDAVRTGCDGYVLKTEISQPQLGELIDTLTGRSKS